LRQRSVWSIPALGSSAACAAELFLHAKYLGPMRSIAL
jgi:hypothetical protein